MNPNPELDPKLEALIKSLQRHNPRDPQAASRARNSFLAEAAQISPRVSNLPQHRLEEWKQKLITFWYGIRKEKSPMFNFALSAFLVLTLVFGAGATTVAAAQAALPDETLYPVKIWSEDARLGWEDDPQAKLDLALQFAANRGEEIQTILASGTGFPDPLLTRFENQQQLALSLAAGLPNDQIRPALEQIHNQALQQEHVMAQLQLNDSDTQQIRTRIQTMLQTQAQIAQQGLENPEWLREQLRLHERDRLKFSLPTVEVTETAIPSSIDNKPLETETSEPGSNYGSGSSQNPWMDGTATPGFGYGPGTGANGNASTTPHPNVENPQKKPSTQPGNGGGGQPDTGNGNRP
jgi:hypothetical protein